MDLVQDEAVEDEWDLDEGLLQGHQNSVCEQDGQLRVDGRAGEEMPG